MPGTNYGAEKNSTVTVYFTDGADNAVYGLVAGTTPTAVAGYAKGCILVSTTTGIPWSNTGTVTSCTFVKTSAT